MFFCLRFIGIRTQGLSDESPPFLQPSSIKMSCKCPQNLPNQCKLPEFPEDIPQTPLPIYSNGLGVANSLTKVTPPRFGRLLMPMMFDQDRYSTKLSFWNSIIVIYSLILQLMNWTQQIIHAKNNNIIVIYGMLLQFLYWTRRLHMIIINKWTWFF